MSAPLRLVAQSIFEAGTVDKFLCEMCFSGSEAGMIELWLAQPGHLAAAQVAVVLGWNNRCSTLAPERNIVRALVGLPLDYFEDEDC